VLGFGLGSMLWLGSVLVYKLQVDPRTTDYEPIQLCIRLKFWKLDESTVGFEIISTYIKNTSQNLYFHIHTRQRYPLTVCVKHAVKHYEQQRQKTTSTNSGIRA